MDPLPTLGEIEQHYRQRFVDGNYATARAYEGVYRLVHRQMADWINPPPGSSVLDVGCFTGELISILAERGADAYGLELQPQAVAVATERMPGRVFQADVEGSTFPPGPYDAVTMIAVIEHVLDPRAFVRRAKQLLAPGGRLFVQTPDASSAFARVLGRHWPPLAPVEHIHLFARRTIRKLLEDEGFRDVRIRAHVKRLSIGYVYEMMAHYGPEWRPLLDPFRRACGGTVLPFAVGEMLVSAVA